MEVTRFLERKWVIQFFGAALIVAPLFNIFFQLLYLKNQQNITWSHIDVYQYITNANPISYILSFASIVIGIAMLGGSPHTWKYVLYLLGSHLFLQIINYKSKVWQTPLAWAAFGFNVIIFIFIADQLVWKYKPKKTLDVNPLPKVDTEKNVAVENSKIIHLKSYKKIMFSFYSDKPWGRLMTLTSHQLVVNCFSQPPQQIENKTVEIRFTSDLVVEIKFDKKENNLYYFTPLNMNQDKVNSLNSWLKKIAV